MSEFTIEVVPFENEKNDKFKIHAIFFNFYGGIEKTEFDNMLDCAVEKANNFCHLIRKYKKDTGKLLEFSYPNDENKKYSFCIGITD